MGELLIMHPPVTPLPTATDASPALYVTGMSDRFASGQISYGPVRFAIPNHALRFYFPALWPEAEADAVLVDLL